MSKSIHGSKTISNQSSLKQKKVSESERHKLGFHLEQLASDAWAFSKLYLAIARSTLGCATQTWALQSIELMRKVERVPRRATKFILRLPFSCTETYQERLARTSLLPIYYWHEYLDRVLFYKAINGLIDISSDVLPKPFIPNRFTRSTNNANASPFRPSKCKIVTFQRSFVSKITRIWNTLPKDLRLNSTQQAHFKRKLKEYFWKALIFRDVDNSRTWRSICPSCNRSRSLAAPVVCCF